MLHLKNTTVNKISLMIITSVLCMFLFGLTAQYSIAKTWNPWAIKHIINQIIGIVIGIGIVIIDISIIYEISYMIYIANIVLLILIPLAGYSVFGAKRWISLYFISAQPSEFAKISTILAAAKYYSEHGMSNRSHLVVAGIVLMPVMIIIKQPDLGTAIILCIAGIAMIFFAGIAKKHIIYCIIGISILSPLLWHRLNDYQKSRIISFVNNSSDKLKGGYQISQSKIAIGSGGVFGKGFMHGTQSQLKFLPAKHNDLIFTVIAEEFGIIGSILFLMISAIFIICMFLIVSKTTLIFHNLVVGSISVLFASHIVINIAMVTGLLPVVGIPLPFVSSGGSAIISYSAMLAIVLQIYYRSLQYKKLFRQN